MLLFLFVCFVCIGDLVSSQGNCRLDPDPSVEYRCILTDNAEGTRACEALEPPGTIVRPQCRRPNYYSTSPLNFMKCIDGYWNYVARCSPECGRVTPGAKGLVVGGRRVKRGELPWHAGIYSKATEPYMQICGGSLISNNVVLSAAHCFWSDKQLPASQYAVAVGKLYRPWDDPNDEAQKSDVKVVYLPLRYQGSLGHYQDDIAMVVVTKSFHFRDYIRPVCLNFDYLFEQQQLYSGNSGKVAGWGLTDANGKPSSVLMTVDLPYVDIGTCIRHSPAEYREFITNDKICAGTLDRTALCQGDSGGGLSFPDLVTGIERYFLRGIVSTAASSEDACNINTYTSFTSINKHETFIRAFLTEATTLADADDSADGLNFDNTSFTDIQNPQHACGLVTLNNPLALMVHGKKDLEGQFPWHAALYQTRIVGNNYLCGGTLVSNRHMITVAHCVTHRNTERLFDAKIYTVILGKQNLRTSIDGVQIRLVDQITIHPNYNGTTYSHNIGILRLREAITYTHWVRPACLWPDDHLDLDYVIGKKGSVVGRAYEDGQKTDDLSLVEMPVVSQETCLKSYIEFFGKFTSDRTFCAGFRDGFNNETGKFGGTLVCDGDSGNAMVIKIGSAFYVRGIVSLFLAQPKVPQCDPNQYIIFTDIAKFVPWIGEIISQ